MAYLSDDYFMEDGRVSDGYFMEGGRCLTDEPFRDGCPGVWLCGLWLQRKNPQAAKAAKNV